MSSYTDDLLEDIRDNTAGMGGGPGGTSTEYDEGTVDATLTGPVVQGEGPSNTVTPLQMDASGNLKVAVSGAGSGGTSSVDGDAYTAATNSGTAMMAAVDDTGTTAAAEDKVGIVRMTPQRGVHVNLRTLAGAETGITALPLRVDPTGTTAQPVITENQLDYDTGAGTDTQSIMGIALPASGGAVAGGTSSNPLRIDPTGTTTQPVSDAGGSLTVDGTFWQATQPVSGTVAVTGVATETTLSALNTKVPAQGQALAAASLPVVLTAIQVAAITPPAAITGFATSAKQDTGNTSVASIDTKTPALGQALAAAAVPVVLTAIQVAAITPPAAITGFATETTLAAESAKLPATLGQKAMTASMAVVLASDQASVPVAATQSGTWTVQPGNTANTTAWKVDGSAVTQPVSMATNTPVGTVAHDSVDSGAPVKVGAKAIAALSTTTIVAAADRVDNQADIDSVLLVRVSAPLGDRLTERSTNTDGASTASTVFGATGSTRNIVDGITVFRTDSASTLAYVDFRDGTGGTVLWSLPLPPNGGSILPPGVVIKTTANTALAWDVSTALTTVIISIAGYKSKVT